MEPPSFEELQAWAGAGRVVRPSPAEVAGWRLPPAQAAALVTSGVPLLDGVVDRTLFVERDGRYRLASTDVITYLAEPDTGRVTEVFGNRFVNSSIVHWLCSLHLVGTWYTTSTAIRTWDEDGEAEQAALDELADVLHRIAVLDPAAFGDGDHETHFWPAVLDRWLY